MLNRLLTSLAPLSSSVRTMASSTTTAATAAPKPQDFTLALCQMLPGKNKDLNLDAAAAAVDEAVEKHKADVVVLPEVFNSPYATNQFPVFAERIPDSVSSLCEGDQPTTCRLHNLAKKHGIYLIGGTFPERDGADIYNTCVVFGPDGSILKKYRKMHLFDIDIPGGITFKESDTLSPGNELVTVDTKFGRIGIGICYDMRFPELALALGQAGCNLLVFPGAFNTTTGPLHWELLLRSRALDSQMYVAGCSPARAEDGYPAWGHSTVVDPWGKVIATTDESVSTVVTKVEFDVMDKIRAQIPILSQKRNDIYKLTAVDDAAAAAAAATKGDGNDANPSGKDGAGTGAGAGAGAGAGSGSGAADAADDDDVTPDDGIGSKKRRRITH